MEYNFSKIEEYWQNYWKENNIYKVNIDDSKPKYYVLDMFPYPSGAGLHVGHPLGYIASDIYSRYKRLNGFNVLHPMGYDAFGLPAEQYAIQTGQHPAKTTEINIKRYREQLDKIGFSYDWDREVKTSDSNYYKWTQWAFIQMFEHWYNNKTQKAEPISELIKEFVKNGNQNIEANCNETDIFSAKEWTLKTEKEQQLILLNYRLAYLANTKVNWCSELGTVLANDEVVNGVSVRGGYEVVQKEMKQWSLRISAYAPRLLDDLEEIEWTDSLKEIQRNWIGKSEGAEMRFRLSPALSKGEGEKSPNNKSVDNKVLPIGEDLGGAIVVFTTRPDTIFGSTFMVLAPESDYVSQVTTDEYKNAVDEYIIRTKKRTERERIAEVEKITGQFTGAYAINPLTNKEIPIYIADYVLAGYGTGAIMAVPGHDSRDFKFARHFDLPIIQVVVGKDEKESDTSTWENSFDGKEGTMINSGFINGLEVQKAISKTIKYIVEENIGEGQINYRLRDAIFSRQRYWGEPFPVYFKDDIPYVIDEKELPLKLPEVDKFLPTEDGQPPLGRAKNWQTKDGHPYELSTMPGFAGSSAYYYRYMDPKNDKALVSKKANEYWQDVDLYIGGTEHATGHLVYARFWNKFLYDLGLVCKKEPFKKLINQGMIQGVSGFISRIAEISGGENTTQETTYPTIYISQEMIDKTKEANEQLKKIMSDCNNYDCSHIDLKIKNITHNIHIDIKHVEGNILNKEEFLKEKWGNDNTNIKFIPEEGKFYVKREVEKMSKSKLNVVNPDNTYDKNGKLEQEGIIEKYGADTLRMYEMFLGPLEQSKPWDTNGIDGVFKFFRKTWRLFHDENDKINLSDENPTKDELKILHKTIKKIIHDIEHFSFNTSISAFMICVNELGNLKCNKKAILEPFTIILSPFAPHIAEELWKILGNKPSVVNTKFPEFKEEYLTENTFEYPVSFNGKMRFKIELPVDMPKEEVEKAVIEHEGAQKWLDGKTPKKIIVVPKRIINIVI